MISINNDIETLYVSFEGNLKKTNEVILNNNKELIFKVVTAKYTRQFIKKQRRINTLKSPFKKIKTLLQEIIGENIEKVQIEEVIDTTQLENEKRITLEIIQNLLYSECLRFLLDINKYGLKQANTIWYKRFNE